jgi:hypothetical protein
VQACGLETFNTKIGNAAFVNQDSDGAPMQRPAAPEMQASAIPVAEIIAAAVRYD